MLSQVRLETNWGMSVDENPIDYKIFNIYGNLENSLCWPNFPKIPCVGQIFLNSLCFPCLEN